jgi:hypothetical protein
MSFFMAMLLLAFWRRSEWQLAAFNTCADAEKVGDRSQGVE